MAEYKRLVGVARTIAGGHDAKLTPKKIESYAKANQLPPEDVEALHLMRKRLVTKRNTDRFDSATGAEGLFLPTAILAGIHNAVGFVGAGTANLVQSRNKVKLGDADSVDPQRVDSNGDGLLNGGAITGEGTQVSELTSADRDGDGKLSPTELRDARGGKKVNNEDRFFAKIIEIAQKHPEDDVEAERQEVERQAAALASTAVQWDRTPGTDRAALLKAVAGYQAAYERITVERDGTPVRGGPVPWQAVTKRCDDAGLGRDAPSVAEYPWCMRADTPRRRTTRRARSSRPTFRPGSPRTRSRATPEASWFPSTPRAPR